MQVVLGGVNFGGSIQPNTGDGFVKSGLPRLVDELLNEIFPDPGDGGVLCVIDNLELLETSRNALRLLDRIRDSLLVGHGLRWVLCGALGIVRSVAATPRLKGYMSTPLLVSGVAESRAGEIFRRRISHFVADPNDHYMPLNSREFEHLYHLFNENARHALSYAHDYCTWISDTEENPTDEVTREIAYWKWLREEADQTFQAVRPKLSSTAWEIFGQAVRLKGEFSPSDADAFGFVSFDEMLPHLKDLERLNVVQIGLDETDARRKVITLTPQGWLMEFARSRRNFN